MYNKYKVKYFEQELLHAAQLLNQDILIWYIIW